MYIKEARDSQRSALYDAEKVLRSPEWRAVSFASVEEMQDYADNLWGQKWVDRNWPKGPRRLEIQKGRGCNARKFGLIRMAEWGWHEDVLLHEIAHVLVWNNPVGDEHEAHGWEFANAFLRLVKNRMGVDARNVLRDSMREHGVRYTAPRTYTPEQREAMRERGKELAASLPGPTPLPDPPEGMVRVSASKTQYRRVGTIKTLLGLPDDWVERGRGTTCVWFLKAWEAARLLAKTTTGGGSPGSGWQWWDTPKALRPVFKRWRDELREQGATLP